MNCPKCGAALEGRRCSGCGTDLAAMPVTFLQQLLIRELPPESTLTPEDIRAAIQEALAKIKLS